MDLLREIRVLDLTRVLSGPYCTMVLADLGANVVKIESPEGDSGRQNGPFINEQSTYYNSVNRNKRGMVIDLKNDLGKSTLLKMLQKADVLVENFRPGVMTRLGLDYDTIKTDYPQLIYCSISGFGQTGPYKNRAAYDIVVQAMSGMMSITGQEGGPPTRVGSSIGDIVAGLFGTIAIIVALYNRNTTNKGTHIDISMFDCQIAILENAVTRYFATNEEITPVGNRHPLITPFDTFKTMDGYVVIAAGRQRLWEHLCTILELRDTIEDERFKTNPLRTHNARALKEIIEGKTIKKTTKQWLDIFLQEGIPCGPVYKIHEMVNDPQVAYRNMIMEVTNNSGISFKMPALPVRFMDEIFKIYKPAPFLGQNTREVLEEYGFSSHEIGELFKIGAVAGE